MNHNWVHAEGDLKETRLIGAKKFIIMRWICHNCGSIRVVEEKPGEDFLGWEGLTCGELIARKVLDD